MASRVISQRGSVSVRVGGKTSVEKYGKKPEKKESLASQVARKTGRTVTSTRGGGGRSDRREIVRTTSTGRENVVGEIVTETNKETGQKQRIVKTGRGTSTRTQLAAQRLEEAKQLRETTTEQKQRTEEIARQERISQERLKQPSSLFKDYSFTKQSVDPVLQQRQEAKKGFIQISPRDRFEAEFSKQKVKPMSPIRTTVETFKSLTAPEGSRRSGFIGAAYNFAKAVPVGFKEISQDAYIEYSKERKFRTDELKGTLVNIYESTKTDKPSETFYNKTTELKSEFSEKRKDYPENYRKLTSEKIAALVVSSSLLPGGRETLTAISPYISAPVFGYSAAKTVDTEIKIFKESDPDKKSQLKVESGKAIFSTALSSVPLVTKFVGDSKNIKLSPKKSTIRDQSSFTKTNKKTQVTTTKTSGNYINKKGELLKYKITTKTNKDGVGSVKTTITDKSGKTLASESRKFEQDIFTSKIKDGRYEFESFSRLKTPKGIEKENIGGVVKQDKISFVDKVKNPRFVSKVEISGDVITTDKSNPFFQFKRDSTVFAKGVVSQSKDIQVIKGFRTPVIKKTFTVDSLKENIVSSGFKFPKSFTQKVGSGLEKAGSFKSNNIYTFADPVSSSFTGVGQSFSGFRQGFTGTFKSNPFGSLKVTTQSSTSTLLKPSFIIKPTSGLLLKGATNRAESSFFIPFFDSKPKDRKESIPIGISPIKVKGDIKSDIKYKTDLKPISGTQNPLKTLVTGDYGTRQDVLINSDIYTGGRSKEGTKPKEDTGTKTEDKTFPEQPTFIDPTIKIPPRVPRKPSIPKVPNIFFGVTNPYLKFTKSQSKTKTKSSSKRKEGEFYSPSFFAASFGIKGKKPSKLAAGLSIRPIIEEKGKKKKRRKFSLFSI